MINRLIELSLQNRFIVIALYVGLAGWGWWALRRDADRRDPRPVRQPGHRLHRLAGPQPAGGRGPGHLSADGQPAGPRRRARRPLAVGVRLLDDLRHLRGQRRPVLRARARARAHEPGHEEPAGRRRADARARRDRRRARLLVHGREPDAVAARPAHACRTGSSAISSTPCPASPKSRRSAATSSSTRSTSIRTACAPTTCRSAPSSPRCATAT